jgi:peptide/nickel transport system ATP-binding protein
MLLEPRMLFADEPTSRLDLLTQQETMDCLMDQVAEQNTALVLVTHDVGLATAVTDRRLSLAGADTARPVVPVA